MWKDQLPQHRLLLLSQAISHLDSVFGQCLHEELISLQDLELCALGNLLGSGDQGSDVVTDVSSGSSDSDDSSTASEEDYYVRLKAFKAEESFIPVDHYGRC
jgi:hypothetical protein